MEIKVLIDENNKKRQLNLMKVNMTKELLERF